MPNAITIGICDDHGLVRSGLRRVIEAEDGLEVTCEAGSAVEALAQVSESRPDVLMLDVTMPGQSGIERTAAAARCRAGDEGSHAVDAG